MCCSCWLEHGAAQIDTPAVRAVLPLIARVYEFSCVGGNLHIVLDDDNLEDHSLEFCRQQIEAGGYRRPPAHVAVLGPDEPDSPEQLAAELACYVALRALTFEERVSALGLHNGCWGYPA
jgi:hypothetical protein